MRVSFGQLRWLTVIVPTGVLALYLFASHFILPDLFDTPVAFAVLIAAAAVAIFFFSQTVFRIVEGLEERIVRQNRELAISSAVATELSRPQDTEKSVLASLDIVLDKLGGTAGVVCVLDEENQELFGAAHRGLSPALVEQVKRSKLGDEPLGTQVIREGEPIVLKDAFEDPRVMEMARREGFRSIVSVPLKSQGRVVGVMGLCSDREALFGDVQLAILERVAAQIGLAVEKAGLFEELADRSRDLAILNDTSGALSSSLNLDEVMMIALDKVLEASGAEVAEMWLLQSEGSAQGPAKRRGVSADALRRAQGAGMNTPERCHVCPVVTEGAPLFVGDGACSDPAPASAADGTSGMGVVACLPLEPAGKLVGVVRVTAHWGHAVSRRQRLLLKSIAGQIGVAVKNAQLYEQVQDMAVLEERDRIAREMHDGLAQVLGYVNTKAFAVRSLLSQGQLSEAQRYLSELEEAAREVYADVREGVLGLRSTSSGNENLLRTLAEYLEKFGRMSGMKVDCQASDGVSDLRLSVTAEVQVLRIVQEALSNVRKHAKAKEARVRLAKENGDLAVVIEDDGVGFDAAKAARGDWPRFGLQTMRERAEGVGGTFEIVSKPGSGTNIVVRIPVSEARETGEVRT